MAYNRWLPGEAEMALRLRYADKTYAQIADALNAAWDNQRTEEKVRDAFRKGSIKRALDGDPETVADRVRTETTEDGAVQVVSNRPFSVEEMAAMFGIDPEDWEAYKVVTNNWAKNFQSKVWWRLVAPVSTLPERWTSYLEELAESSPRYHLPTRAEAHRIMYELSLNDAHIGMKAWGPETGEDYDLYIGLARYRAAFRYLVARRPENLDRFLLVVGQDLAHFDNLIDGKGGATAKGTVQDVDTRWQKLFVAICEMLAELIEEALEYARVDIVVQPGNHDTRTSFYIGQWLEARFWNDERVRVDNTPKPRKYVRYGCTLIGFAHGHQEKGTNYHTAMSTEAAKDWAETTEHEWHLGHRHHEAVKQDGACTVRISRCLSGVDSWHRENGYLPQQGAHGYVWDYTAGLLRQEYYSVPVTERQTDNLGVVLRG